MDGIHDLGGMQGFGPVERVGSEPVFAEEWGGRAFGLAMGLFMLGFANGGEFRHAIERMDPAHYLASPYYEHWLTAVATLAVEKGIVSHDELQGRAGGPFPLSRPPAARDATPAGASSDEPRFGVGDQVRVRDLHPSGHTRCPGYVRRRRGTVVRFDGVFSVPDLEAHSDQRRTEATYSVRFEAAELWGDEAEVNGSVQVDLWESYLEAS